jgi:predicted enzyme related to lactoylglutathione lyase
VLKLSSIMVNSEDPSKLVEFYDEVFGKSEWSDGGFTGWKSGESFFMVGPHSEIKGDNKEPARIMMMLETEDVTSECERVTAAGAKVIAEPYHPGDNEDMWLATLADPDGNYFQLASPWKEQ